MQGRDHPVLLTVPETYLPEVLHPAKTGVSTPAPVGVAQRAARRGIVKSGIPMPTRTPLRTAAVVRLQLGVSELAQGVRRRTVPMREIALSGGEPPLRVYDTSGPQGCRRARRPAASAARRGSSAAATSRKCRDRTGPAPPSAADAAGARRRGCAPRCAATGAGHAAALRAQGRDHAGDGVHRDPRRASTPSSCAPKSRAAARSSRPTSITPSSSR